MRRITDAVLSAIGVVVVGTVAVLWLAGIVDFSLILTLGIGAIVVSVFIFIGSIWVRIPFQRLDQSVAGLVMIIVVVIGMLFLLPWLRTIAFSPVT